jgi:hypothetical protein
VSVLSLERFKFAEAELVASSEGSMCAIARRDGVAPPGSWATSCMEGHRWNRRGPTGSAGLVSGGGGGKAQPEPLFELRSGVGLVHSTDETVEGDETR